MVKPDTQAIRDMLLKFQDGYDRRETAFVEDFRELFTTSEDMEVIGTGGIIPGDDEWCLGPDAACELVRNDWEGWGDLKLDTVQARIHILGSVAWLATTGTVTMEIDPTEAYNDYLSYIQKMADDDDTDPKSRMLEILRAGSNTLFEGERGKNYTWPIRFTAVLVGKDENWLFHQITFSFATTRFPDVRNV